ncbi:hypothetical protein [Pseudochelatococcus contaminans]|nr:hypothetical protein [Pseudochelatococcus contaminans]
MEQVDGALTRPHTCQKPGQRAHTGGIIRTDIREPASANAHSINPDIGTPRES